MFAFPTLYCPTKASVPALPFLPDLGPLSLIRHPNVALQGRHGIPVAELTSASRELRQIVEGASTNPALTTKPVWQRSGPAPTQITATTHETLAYNDHPRWGTRLWFRRATKDRMPLSTTRTYIEVPPRRHTGSLLVGFESSTASFMQSQFFFDQQVLLNVDGSYTLNHLTLLLERDAVKGLINYLKYWHLGDVLNFGSPLFADALSQGGLEGTFTTDLMGRLFYHIRKTNSYKTTLAEVRVILDNNEEPAPRQLEIATEPGLNRLEIDPDILWQGFRPIGHFLGKMLPKVER